MIFFFFLISTKLAVESVVRGVWLHKKWNYFYEKLLFLKSYLWCLRGIFYVDVCVVRFVHNYLFIFFGWFEWMWCVLHNEYMYVSMISWLFYVTMSSCMYKSRLTCVCVYVVSLRLLKIVLFYSSLWIIVVVPKHLNNSIELRKILFYFLSKKIRRRIT